MSEKTRTKSEPARNYSTLRRSAWILIFLSIVSAAVAVAVFRLWLLPPASKVEAGLTVAEAFDATTFGP
ncbi:MAG: hypothetical protein WBZ01_19355, partial [Terriglobales bacterium]